MSFLTSVLGACAGGGQGLDANGDPINGVSTPPLALAADFKSIQANVFTPLCVRCHSGASAPEGLQLDEAHSYALLVGVPSAEQPAFNRVTAGDPNSSYIIRKLQGGPGISGEQMPLGGPYLSQGTLNVLKQWISDGAQSAAPAGGQTAGAFAVSAISPPDGAHVRVGARPIVVAFNHEPDFSRISEASVHLERVTPEGVREVPGGVMLRLAGGNPATVLLTPRLALASGVYRLTVPAAGADSLSDVNAQPLARSHTSEFTVEDAP